LKINVKKELPPAGVIDTGGNERNNEPAKVLLYDRLHGVKS